MEIDKIKELLRENRIKHGTDYAIMVKYGAVHVICGSVYEDYIRQAFDLHQIEITSIAII